MRPFPTLFAMTEEASQAEELDVRRLLCPIPVIRTQNRIRTMSPGQQLVVIATDPGVRNDIPAWCRMFGHQVELISEQEREIRIVIRVGASL